MTVNFIHVIAEMTFWLFHALRAICLHCVDFACRNSTKSRFRHSGLTITCRWHWHSRVQSYRTIFGTTIRRVCPAHTGTEMSCTVHGELAVCLLRTNYISEADQTGCISIDALFHAVVGSAAENAREVWISRYLCRHDLRAAAAIGRFCKVS